MIHRLSELLTQYFMKYGQATDKAEVYIYTALNVLSVNLLAIYYY